MELLRLLVYEYVSAVGLNEPSLQSSVLSEGFGMLRTITADAKAAGLKVTTILNKQIADVNPPLNVDQKIPVNSQAEAEHVFQKTAENTDAALIIAPETNDTLQKLVEKIEQTSTTSLNSSANSIAQVTDKALLQQHAKKLGLTTPETLSLNVEENAEETAQIIDEKIGFPAIIKPTNSVACEALNIVKNQEEAKTAITKIAKLANRRFMAQKLIQGTHASVTLISNGTEAQPVTLNGQNLSLKPPNQTSTYNGGTSPLNHKQQTKAFAAAKKLVQSIQGLKGYIGVDFVLTDDDPVVIEVNPRITTSFIGIQKILNLNLTEAILNAALKRELPTNPKTTGYAYFEKVKTANPTNTTLKQTYAMPELVSPPFPTKNSDFTYSFICTQGSTPQQAKREFNKAKKQLYNILLIGGTHKR